VLPALLVTILLPIDAFAMCPGSGSFFVENGKVMYQAKVIEGLDAKTFRTIPSPNEMEAIDGPSICMNYPVYARDSRSVYYLDQKIEKVDISSFVYVGNGFAKDKNSVFYAGRPFQDADPASFRKLPGQEQFLFRDRHHVFSRDGVIKGADPETYKLMTLFSYGDFLGIDAKHVFINNTVLAHANRDHVRIIGSDYWSDGQKIFCKSEPLPNADMKSFSSVAADSAFAYLAQDSRFYYCGKLFRSKSECSTIGKHFLKCDNQILFDCKKVDRADPKSFHFLGIAPMDHCSTTVVGRYLYQDRYNIFVIDGARSAGILPGLGPLRQFNSLDSVAISEICKANTWAAMNSLMENGTFNGRFVEKTLITAVERGLTTTVLEELADGEDVNQQDKIWGYTPLIHAVKNGFAKPEIVRLLLSHGANPNLEGYGGFTALMFAVGTDNDGVDIEVIETLLESGAQPNVKTQYGFTALMYASKRLDATLALLTHGADPNIKNNRGATALSMAKKAKKTDVVNALLKAGAK
jgi:ankyrin repeat protein